MGKYGNYENVGWSEFTEDCHTTLTDMNEERLIAFTSMGMAGELGEFIEVFKKHLWQGHPLDREKAREEAGDFCYYFALALEIAGLDLDDVLRGNHDKLLERYHQGKFSVQQSIERKDVK